MKPQFLIGGATMCSGKTIFAMGLLRALKKRGIKVQPYKCGPDFLDPQLHCISSGTDSVNLDLWLSGRTHLQYIYNKYGDKSDVCVIEGNAGLYDGYRRMQGSSAEMSNLLSVPVILVVNARMSAYSVAPLLYGFKHFRPVARIAGVVFTNVSSAVHFSHLKDACSDAGLSCLGYIPYDESLKLPAKHSSLTQTARLEIEEVIEKASSYVCQNIDIDKILKSCTRIFPCEYTLPYTSDVEEFSAVRFLGQHKKMRIAIARDAAFNFIYKENLDKLSALGNILFFSPLYGKDMPELNPQMDILYLPGGYPELFARQLHRRKSFMEQLKQFADSGGRIIAEGGGMSLLCNSLTVRDGGTAYKMSGVFPFDCSMSESRHVSGYRMAERSSCILKGYETRYIKLSSDTSSTEPGREEISATTVSNTKGTDAMTPVFRYKNVIAGFTHWYWGEIEIMSLWNS